VSREVVVKASAPGREICCIGTDKNSLETVAKGIAGSWEYNQESDPGRVSPKLNGLSALSTFESFPASFKGRSGLEPSLTVGFAIKSRAGMSVLSSGLGTGGIISCMTVGPAGGNVAGTVP
jgi:hypothetical protein